MRKHTRILYNHVVYVSINDFAKAFNIKTLHEFIRKQHLNTYTNYEIYYKGFCFTIIQFYIDGIYD